MVVRSRAFAGGYGAVDITDRNEMMETFEITLQSVQPVDLGDLGAAGFESLVKAAGIDTAFSWDQDEEGRIRVAFRHEAADRDRALGVSERIASELGTGVWTAQVDDVSPS
jgi:hypothetical protein